MGIAYVVVRRFFPPKTLLSFTLLGTDRMVVFFIALLLLCFTISNMATRIFVGIISVLMAGLIMWCIRSTWETGNDQYASLWRDSLAAMRRTHRDWIGYMKQLRAGALISLISFPTRRTPEDVHNSRPMVEVAGV
jgi:hypothetical protein